MRVRGQGVAELKGGPAVPRGAACTGRPRQQPVGTCACVPLPPAGYRPSTFTNYLKVVEGFWESEEEILLTYSPAAEQELAARWELDTCGRCAWAGMQQEAY